jgi:hypothetical protein
MDLSDREEHYIHDGIEVVMTGRKAERRVGSRVAEIFEIEPADGTGVWKKWVKLDQLYKIV